MSEEENITKETFEDESVREEMSPQQPVGVGESNTPLITALEKQSIDPMVIQG